MRKFWIGLLAASCATSAIAGGGGVSWKLSEASGPVQVLHGGVSRAASRNDVVGAGDTVTTGRNGRAVLVRGAEFVMVAPGSELRLPEDESSSGITRLFQNFGSAVFMIKKKTNPHFEVKTPYLAAVVKGTTFNVTVTPSGASVQVLEGAVDVATPDGGARELITPGSVALVGARDLYDLHIDGAAGHRVIESVSKPADQTPGASTSVALETSASPIQQPPSALQSAPLAVTVHSETVSLTDVTNGFVSGTVGESNRTELAAVNLASNSSGEATTSVVRATEVATASLRSDESKSAAVESVAVEAGAVEKSGGAKAASEQAARLADQAQQSLTEAEMEKSKSDAAKKAAEDVAASRAAEAAAATAAANRAEADHEAKVKTQIDAQAAALLASKIADDAKKLAETQALLASSATDDQARQDAAKAAEKAAKDAEKAVKDAEKAEKDALKAADDAAKAAAEKAAKDAERAAKDVEAAKAVKDAEKAAKDALNATEEKAAKEAEKAAKDAEKAAAKAAEEAAKAKEDAAKEARKLAEDAAKAAQEAEKASKDKSKDVEDAAKEIEKALKGKG